MYKPYLIEALKEIPERAPKVSSRIDFKPSRKTIQTRILLALSARELLRENSWDKVSVEAVTSNVGMVKATAFHHYPGKIALFCEAAHLAIDDIEAEASLPSANITDSIDRVSHRLSDDHNLAVELWQNRLKEHDTLSGPLDRLDTVTTDLIKMHDLQLESDTSLLMPAHVGSLLATHLLLAEAHGVTMPLDVTKNLLQWREPTE